MSACCDIPSRSSYCTGSQPGGTEVTARAVELAGPGANARVADIGCGRGDAVEWLRAERGFRATGVDRDPCRFLPGVPLAAADAACLPFADSSLDLVLAQCSLSTMHDRRRVLEECARVLKPAGQLALSDVYARNPAAARLAGLPVRAELTAELERAGFAVRVWEDHSHVLTGYILRHLMESGSPEDWWPCGCQDQAALRRARPGYYLLVAAKGGTPRGF